MRLIDADAIPWTDLNADMPNTKIKVLITFADKVNRMPTIEERKKGEWTKGSDMPPMKHRNGKPKKFWPSFRYCSVCGREAFDDSDWGEQLFDFCPYCGADMRGGDHEND